MTETWEQYYIIIQYSDRRYVLTVVHYQSCDESLREWYRIIPEEYDIMIGTSEQLFGFGRTLEIAIKEFVTSLERNGRSQNPHIAGV